MAFGGPAPYIPLFFLSLLIILIGIPWYRRYDAPYEQLCKHLWAVGMFSPFLILPTLIFIYYYGVGKCFSFPELGPSSIHRAAGSPWGMAMIFLFLAKLSYRSNNKES